MPDFGIGEALAAFAGTEAAAAPAEFAAAAPLAFTVNALPEAAAAAGGAAEAGAGIGLGDLLGGAAGGLAAGAGAIGDALFPGASAGELAPGATPGVPGAAGGAGATLPSGITPGSVDLGLSSAPGASAGAFSPSPGVELPSGIAPDATSAAGLNPQVDSFASRAAPAEQAIADGTFDPVGSGYTTFSQAPPGSLPTTPVAGTPTATPNLGDFATPPAAQPTAGTPGFDASGNPSSGPYGSNPQTPYGATNAQYDPAGATAGANPAAGGAAGNDTSILGKLGQGALDSVTKNPLGLALAGGGLGLNLLNAKKESAAVKQLQSQAGQQSATANQLANYALTGTVPAGSQAGIDQAIAEAKANAVSNAAGQGLPTDPTKNSALATTLAKIDEQGPILASQIAQQLLTSGASYAGLSDQLYTQLAQIDQTQKANMGKAIASMAAALNTGGTRIQIGGSSSA